MKDEGSTKLIMLQQKACNTGYCLLIFHDTKKAGFLRPVKDKKTRSFRSGQSVTLILSNK